MPVEVIAEIGINHQNDMATAERMIDAAVISGADAIKFQCSTVTEEISFVAAPDHFREIGALVPTTHFLAQCKRVCDDAGIEFLCTPAGLDSLKIVQDLGVKRIKVASDNLTNIPFLQAVARTDLPVILSTGMGTQGEIEVASRMFRPDLLTLMHCVSAYPTPLGQMNLSAIRRLKLSGLRVGLSDHSTSVLVGALAVMLGAVMVEKHFTLDRTMAGPDHAASLEPRGFREMVMNIRKAEEAFGDGKKQPQPVEIDNMPLYRKSIVASRDIAAGEYFGKDNMVCKRPGTGRPASDWFAVYGTMATRDYKFDDLIE